MVNRFSLTASLVLSLIGSVFSPAAGQEDNGQKYAKMTDAELWAMVVKCKDRKSVVALLDQIPLAVMAKHAVAAQDRQMPKPGFGQMVVHVIWPELWNGDAPSETYNRLFKTYLWTDDSGGYEVRARLFDVAPEIVVLQKSDGNLIPVPLQRLSVTSNRRLAKYVEARRSFGTRIPEDTAQIAILLPRQMGPFPEAGTKAREYLYSGRLKEGEAALMESLAANDDPNERFGLGLIQFMLSLETLVQDLNRHGFLTQRTFGNLMPEELRKTFPDNQAPEEFSNDVFRKMIETWVSGLERADKTLSQVGNGEVKLRLEPSKIKIDPAGRSRPVSAREILRLLFSGPAAMSPGAAEATIEQFVELRLSLDRGDVHWLRGYLHLQMALGESILAVDFNPIIEIFAHRLFEKVKTPHQWLLDERRNFLDGNEPMLLAIVKAIADAVAALSEVLHLDVIKPERFKTASQHLAITIEQSRKMWNEILVEQDNDQEWIPNPQQTGAIGVNVDDQMIKTWLQMLDEIELILRGERLIPFWRFAITGNWNGSPGINLKKIVDQPPERLALILWIQGTAATPYLEKGKFTGLSEAEFLQQIERVFGFNYFGGYALWFN